ncbi:MAG: Beta-galactosidase trimerization domain protein [Chthonomonadales bacterium]|nr:Beta-galactosidase trimerization domain protein [Chthonomonadales bacterium]
MAEVQGGFSGRIYRSVLAAWLCLVFIGAATGAIGKGEKQAALYVRFKLLAPSGERTRVVVGGFRHSEPWYFPEIAAEVAGGTWSGWIDLSAWPWHGRLDRSGGVAEWPAMKLTASQIGAEKPLQGCAFAVQLADQPDEKSAIVSFEERSASNAIAFLVPNPLREHAGEFETGSQMAARHLAWARAATHGKPIQLKHFDILTALWGHYDPALEREDLETLHTLGFNVVSNADPRQAQAAGMRTYRQTGLYVPDPEVADRQWEAGEGAAIRKALATPETRRQTEAVAHWVVADEVSALDLRSVDPDKRNGWFRDYLHRSGVTAKDLGRPLDLAEYPAAAMVAERLPGDADLPTHRLLYYAAKFSQWWSVRQLRHTSGLVHGSLPGMKTETLLPSHGFFGNAWGPAYLGMSYRMLDYFQMGSQQAVEELSAEDWLGLNHMYGPGFTWTGGQTFGYYNALLRSAIQDRPIALRSLITPSDDVYLRLKAYSALAQGTKSFFFWTYGPTYIGTENYWSDLRSEYEGIANLNRALAPSEEVLFPANPVRDPVAILYSVSHDLWHTNDAAAFVEKRLLWHSLRHLGIQPDFLCEEDVEQGRLKQYKVLYIPDWCITRKASAAIDAWVRQGGIVSLSAGAATHDEFNTPYVPPFARTVWAAPASLQLPKQNHTYNERTDLPTLTPLTTATVRNGAQPFTLPVLGCRLNLRADLASRPTALRATFADGSPAAAVVKHGRGQVFGTGFLPMLAYGQLAAFKPKTLEERWPAAPRTLTQLPLTLAKVTPQVYVSVPVVEAGLLTGPNGSALVLANYAYQPLPSLGIDIKLTHKITRIISVEGNPVHWKQTANGIHLETPLNTTDILLLKPLP